MRKYIILINTGQISIIKYQVLFGWEKYMVTFITKQDYVYENLKNDILNGKYTPGEKLVVSDIAQIYNVSAMPVREAIAKLEHDGFIVTKPHLGARIATLNLDEYVQYTLARGELECLAVSLSMPFLTEKHIENLRDINSQLAPINSSKDYREFAIINRKFHEATYNFGPYTYLYNTINDLMVRTQISYSVFSLIPDRNKNSIKEHLKIIDALQARDYPNARATILFQKYSSEISYLKKLSVMLSNPENPNFYIMHICNNSSPEKKREMIDYYIDLFEKMRSELCFSES